MTLATSKNLTILGIATIIGALATAATALFDGDPATTVDWNVTVAAIVTGIGFVLAKGAASTGGTVPATPEARARLQPPESLGAIGFGLDQDQAPTSRPPAAIMLVLLALTLGSGCALLQGKSSITVADGTVCVETTQYVTIGQYRCTGICVGGAMPVQLRCEQLQTLQVAATVASTASPPADPSGTLLTLEQGRALGLVR